MAIMTTMEVVAEAGRITIGHVIAGAIAKKLLKTKNIEIVSQVVQIGDIMAHSNDFDTVKRKC